MFYLTPIPSILRRSMSSAACEVSSLKRSREPGENFFCAHVPAFFEASAIHTVPTGFSGVPPVGPATPVTASA